MKTNTKLQNKNKILFFLYTISSAFVLFIILNINNINAIEKKIEKNNEITNDYLKDNKLDSKYQKSWEMISVVNKKYPNSIFIAFYSIEELRPFSILKFEKYYSKYEKKWEKPEVLALNLTTEEKDSLMLSIIKYVEDNKLILNNNNINRFEILNKIKHWNIAFTTLEQFMFNYDLNLADFLNLLHKNTYLTKELDEFARLGEFDSKMMSEIDHNEAYHTVLNKISNSNFKEQLKIYSEIYEDYYSVNSN